MILSRELRVVSALSSDLMIELLRFFSVTSISATRGFCSLEFDTRLVLSSTFVLNSAIWASISELSMPVPAGMSCLACAGSFT